MPLLRCGLIALYRRGHVDLRTQAQVKGHGTLEGPFSGLDPRFARGGVTRPWFLRPLPVGVGRSRFEAPFSLTLWRFLLEGPFSLALRYLMALWEVNQAQAQGQDNTGHAAGDQEDGQAGR